MKKFLHKLPVPVLAWLCLAGCANNAPKSPEDYPTAIPSVPPMYGPIDTVYVLNVLPKIYGDLPHIWATNKLGDDFDGTFNVRDYVVFPATGDEVVIVSGNTSPLYDYQIIKNLSAEKRKQEYMKSK